MKTRIKTAPFAALAVVLIALAGCAATKEAQVRGALLNAGLPQGVAQCMATPLARDLSVKQLQSLNRVTNYARGEGRGLTQGQVLDLFRRDLDPETLGVVVRAGIGCFLRG